MSRNDFQPFQNLDVKAPYMREDGRAVDELRPVKFEPGFAPSAAGSVLVSMGRTRVICAVTIEERIPGWMRFQKIPGGWLTAEYSMLPFATSDRNKREATQGKVGGRTSEIQRLIGRSLRAAVDLEKLGPRTLWVDCDVVEADGGTRTASITGGYVALALAIESLKKKGKLKKDPLIEQITAVSVGVVKDTPLLDLCYVEDVGAEVDMNVVMTGEGKYVEVQGTAESGNFGDPALQEMLSHARKGAEFLAAAQRDCLASV